MNNLDLIEKLKNSPCYLFLGQNYLKYGNNVDPFLNSINKHFELDCTTAELNYNLLLNIADKNEITSSLGWMQNRSNKISKPEWLNKIANIPWNGVFTSAVDTIIGRSFQNNWREVQSVFSPDSYPKDFRSKSKMHISYLFGSISQETLEERPPLNRLELLTARHKAIKLLGRVNKEFLTPFGLFIIDGYDPDNDWLKLDDLYPVLESLDKGQAYMFGVKDELHSNPLILHLIENQKLIISPLTLLESLINVDLDFNIDDFSFEEHSINKRITINNKVSIMPKELYNDISKTALVLDDRILLPKYEFETDIETQKHFRNFLFDSSTSPVWEAYKHKFNVPRSYEKEISNEIDKILYDKEHYYSHPIILHGQTGTGKTVSLGAVAYKYKLNKKYPILFITRNTQNISFNIIDDFCKWAEDSGADKTIIFWDDTIYDKAIDEYLELNNYLISKGRKVIIIGSAYKLKEDIIKKHVAIYIEAPVVLNDREKKDFHDKFNSYSGRKETLELLWEDNYDNNFLVALYRLLPGSKYSIRKGVISEVETYETTLGKVLKITTDKSLNAMEQAFLDSGIDISTLRLDEEENNFNFQNISEIVSVIGQFGQGIPIELLLRTLEGEFNLEIAEIITKLDYFHTLPTSNGGLKVYPRHKLEAQIIAQSKLKIQNQIDLIIRILTNIKMGDFRNQDELVFMVELLKAIGPNNEEQVYKYRSYYKRISETLEFLRTEYEIYNQRTIIQETTYLREFVKFDNNIDSDEKISLLQKAERILKEEISKTDYMKAKNRFLGTLLIELSSNLGAQLKFKILEKKEKKEILNNFNQLQEYLKKAQIYSSDSYYPLDIWAWTTEAMLDYNLSGEEKSDIYAKFFAAFDKAEAENPEILQREDYNERLVSMGDLSGYLDISEEAFNKLIEMGSSSGIYLRAKKIISSVDLQKPLKNTDEEVCKEAIEYLESYKENILQDEKCLFLLLKLIWAYNNKKPLFYNEKQTLHFSRDNWDYLKFILEKIITLNNGNTTPQVKYLRAITLFHLGEINECLSTFTEIRDNYYIGARRIIISYIASNSLGKPLIYSGQLDSLDSNKAMFYIPELRKQIPYFNRNFIAKDPEIKTTYTQLTLGFNFLGIQVASHVGGGVSQHE
ncbi:DEAD/DEAH box helicase family protein [Paenibacillus glacialis]|uniref:Novel STAND NTPase 5 domain-containing protein n=1 Tax=Paenibacillus glacialis TaxID=494026 RepID=A0A168JPB2_9BACL|nr:DEAD/DEAH box helicase family protein [Paenibacillus glacialis]OAB40901.1 hypothetical protein PGLA_17510 [Paenibacillus glacialis]